MTKPSRTSLFSGWRVWGLPAFASVLAPWQERLTQIPLISPFFEPTLSIAASVGGPLTAFVAYAYLQPKTKSSNRRTAVCGLLTFLFLLLGCITLNHTIGITWFPGPHLQIAMWVLWASAYLGMFCFFGITLVASAIVVPKSK